MIVHINKSKIIKKVARNEYMSDYRKTNTQVIKSKTVYNRKCKHRSNMLCD